MKTFMTFVAICVVASATVIAAGVDLKKVQCVVANKAATAGQSADYKNAKVYFCCGGCAGKFAANAKKYAERANHQLVATKQYVQKGCPFSGGQVKAGKSINIAGTDVGFCCDGCKNKVASAKDDAARMKLVFSEKAFGKGFAKQASK
jgi:YHS domain-containing protein